MQKIAFVSIVLLFGLFSLQIGVGKSLKSQLNPPETVSQPVIITSAAYYNHENHVVYIHPGDSIVVVRRVDHCVRL